MTCSTLIGLLPVSERMDTIDVANVPQSEDMVLLVFNELEQKHCIIAKGATRYTTSACGYQLCTLDASDRCQPARVAVVGPN
jgi:hypothetical protein